MVKLLIDRNELQHALGVGKSTVFKLIKRGDLKPVNIGRDLRFRVADVEAMIAAKTAA
ncbi:AlpA family transcriptional regulator [Rhizobium sp. 18055]|uniref:helix-turn-helix transcriptional regulator n=1 Tax=Rhizobium sp. 18055 TaxID=2681403 RepID=UPI001358197C|nr:helix-turn-helix domain-containing protein [Rhizobium sp. 18055]